MIPFWEYSQCLEWAENHILIGTSFDLTLKNAKRFLGSIKKYYEFLQSQGKLADSEELDKAIKTTLFEEKWSKLLEAAMRISTARTAKVKNLQERMTQAGYMTLGDIAYNDITVTDAERAKSWFYDSK